MTAVNFDRDLRWIGMGVGIPAFVAGAAYADVFQASLTPLYETVGTIRRGPVPAANIRAGLVNAVGLMIVGPDGTDGSPYRIKGSVWCSSPDIDIFCFLGIAPEAPAVGAASPVSYLQFLASGDRNLHVDDTLNVAPFGTIDSVDLSERNIVFGFAFGNETTADIPARFTFNMSVQRLSVKPPRYEAAVR